MLAILLIANPFMMLFFQNCSSMPQSLAKSTTVHSEKKTVTGEIKESRLNQD
jgi:hypothetical protein